jgi:DNA-binding SARP family transcriptional activator
VQRLVQIMAVMLEVLGPVRLTNGSIKPVRGRKRQAFLAYLLEARIAGRPEVSKMELIDALHPDVDEPRALNALRVEVHELRTQLNPDVVVTTSTGYRLGEIQTDAEAFLQSRDTRLWRAAYLEGISFERDDDSGYQILTAALHECALKLLASNPQESARVMRLLVVMEPFDLDFLRTKLRAFRTSNNHRTLGRAYAKARARLHEVGEHLPGAWTEFLDGV